MIHDWPVKAQRFGELVVVLGVIVVAVSLAGVFGDLTLPLDAEHVAWIGVGLIVIGEALVLKG